MYSAVTVTRFNHERYDNNTTDNTETASSKRRYGHLADAVYGRNKR
jgi:hypothetical protein